MAKLRKQTCKPVYGKRKKIKMLLAALRLVFTSDGVVVGVVVGVIRELMT